MTAADLTMRCAECGTEKHWRDGFPERIAAVCWECAWRNHDRTEHPMSRREKRRRAKDEIRRVKAKYSHYSTAPTEETDR